MIDRTRTLIAAAAITVVALLGISIGFVAGRATADTSSNETETANSQDVGRDGEGLPAGPTRIENDVPMGFAHTEEGAVAAAATWLALLVSSPSSERPSDIVDVLESGTESPVPDSVTRRYALIPWAGRIASVSADDEYVVELLAWGVGPESVRDDVDFLLHEVPVAMAWNEQVEDWRIANIEADLPPIDPPLSIFDASGYQVLRSEAATLGSDLVEEVPGE